jgi:PhnB protein
MSGLSSQPYLFFGGRCEEAIEHYRAALGAQVEMVMRFNGCEEASRFHGFSLSISVATEGEVDRVFAALGEGGQVPMPLTKTFWSPRFGMLTDRFGVGWMVSVEAKQSTLATATTE